MGDKMPRPRKYDYKEDYPVKLFIKVPIKLINVLENKGFTQTDIQNELERSKVVETFLGQLAEKTSKKD